VVVTTAAVGVAAGALETATTQQGPPGTMGEVAVVAPLLATGLALAAATPTLPGAPTATGEQMQTVTRVFTSDGLKPETVLLL
jgi:hypothetical protein